VDLSRQLPLGPVFKASGYVLSPDFETISPLDSLMGAIQKLRSGQKFMLFPEGTRSPVGDLRSFHAGAFKMARKAQVPIQPVLIKDYPPFMPKGSKWYYPLWEVSRLKIEYLEPIPPPAKGEERSLAKELENRYRRELGLPLPGMQSGLASPSRDQKVNVG